MSGPIGGRDGDELLGLARAKAAQTAAQYQHGSEPLARDGCRRPLQILLGLVLLTVLIGWTLTIVTTLTT